MVIESTRQSRRHTRHGLDPWSRKWQPTAVFLPGKFHGQRSLVGYSPGGSKESDMTEQLTHFKIMMYVKLWNNLIGFKRKGNGLSILKPGNKGKETCAIN